MTATGSIEQHRTKQWTLHLQVFEDGDLTTVHAVLDTGDNTLRSRATARRSPNDPDVPEIGDEFAAGRALVDLGHQLLRAGETDTAALDPGLRS
ncbi:dsRBD fold-containing protein [Kitasatospora sp. NPDC057015]|uniref:dsRBD fold-containing protein n=1 Tax=Kitasatospora sp. NPDC057015 TaxID=3346001 RepID=UPI0036390C35